MAESKKGSSIKIYRTKKFIIRGSIILPRQTTMPETTEATGTLKNSTTTITVKNETTENIVYNVQQYSPTIKEPIRILLEGIIDYKYGYQRLANFELVYRKGDKKLFVFANNEHTDLLHTRLKDIHDKVELEEVEFDFGKIRSIPQIKNIWGVWEKVNMAYKSVNASFGVDVDKSKDVKLVQATAVNFKMDLNGKLYTLTLSKEGRISSKSILDHKELIDIFDKYFSDLVKP